MEPVLAIGARQQPIVFTEAELARHLYILGRSGSGKSTFLHNLARVAIERGEGLIFIDPEGAEAHRLIDAIPSDRTRDTVYLDASDPDFSVGFNPLANIAPGDPRTVTATNVALAFKTIWDMENAPRMEWFIYSGVSALLETPDATLLDLPRLFTDAAYRTKATAAITEPVAWRFWNEEFPNYSRDYQSDSAGAILNKIGQFISSPTIRAILGQRHPKFDLGTALARGQIVIVNLARGTIGETSSRLLGGLFSTYLHQHVTARPAENPDIPPINVIVDEFQLLGANLIFRDLMSSSRKRRIRMTIAHQNLAQIDDKLREEILSNISTLVAFKLGPNDAELLAEELDCPRYVKLTDLDPGIARIKSPIVTSPQWIECADRTPHTSRATVVITASRERFARRRELVERDFRVSDAERAAAARRASRANGARNR